MFITVNGQMLGDKTLTRVIPSFDVDDLPWQQAVQSLSHQVGVAITVHTESIEKSLNPDLHVSLHLKNVTLAAALDHLLRADEASGQYTALTYWQTLDGGTIHVGTVEDRDSSELQLRVYDIRPLLTRYVECVKLFPRPEKAASNAGRASSSATFSWPATAPAPALFSAPDNYDEVLGYLADLIRRLDEATWKENGGQTGTLLVWGDKLIVTQTPRNHDRIAALLEALAASPPAPPGRHVAAGVLLPQ